MSQKVIVSDNGEKLHSVFDTLKSGDEREEPIINLGNFMSDDMVIKPKDITCKREITKDGGKITIEFKYQSK